MIKVMHVGAGPLGIAVLKQLLKDSRFKLISVVDNNPNLIGKTLKDIDTSLDSEIKVQDHMLAAIAHEKPDVAMVTTVSSLNMAQATFDLLLKCKTPVVSSCEELSFPWKTQATLAKALDDTAQEHNVALLGTGVNPGFLMDALPSMLSLVTRDVKHVQVNRVQNALSRRVPFQQKIGAGLSIKEFEERKKQGVLRHVGLTESMHMIAHALNWSVDECQDIIEPVLLKVDTVWQDKTLTKGMCAGLQQTGTANMNGKEKIKLNFCASISEQESYDEVILKSDPPIHCKIQNGVHGDTATINILINCLPKILKARPGLRTMLDV